jgi:1,4-dihydroxy-2-naphthoate octaprenyltransferase
MEGRRTQDMESILGPMRVPFLLLTPACVFLGAGSARWTDGPLVAWQVALVLVGALGAHISVNALNEYYDFRSGLDFHTIRTPFSGGSGTLPTSPGSAGGALVTGAVAASVTAGVGIYLVILRGPGLLPLGILGLGIIASYTPWLTRSPLLCLIAPGTGFGLLMVMGTDFALTGSYSWTAFTASLVPFFLVNNLLLLNQFPDVAADRRVGRRHLPIVAGLRVAGMVYGLFHLFVHLSIVVGVVLGLMPPACLLGLLALLIAVPNVIKVFRESDGEIGRLIPAMGGNVMLNLITPVLVGVGFLIA